MIPKVRTDGLVLGVGREQVSDERQVLTVHGLSDDRGNEKRIGVGSCDGAGQDVQVDESRGRISAEQGAPSVDEEEPSGAKQREIVGHGGFHPQGILNLETAALARCRAPEEGEALSPLVECDGGGLRVVGCPLVGGQPREPGDHLPRRALVREFLGSTEEPRCCVGLGRHRGDGQSGEVGFTELVAETSPRGAILGVPVERETDCRQRYQEKESESTEREDSQAHETQSLPGRGRY